MAIRVPTPTAKCCICRISFTNGVYRPINGDPLHQRYYCQKHDPWRSKTCVYDNPRTMARECYRDGKLIAFYHYTNLPISDGLLYFGYTVGDWNIDNIIGDRNALSAN